MVANWTLEQRRGRKSPKETSQPVRLDVKAECGTEEVQFVRRISTVWTFYAFPAL